MKTLKFTLTLGLVSQLLACDPAVDYYRVVYNETSHEVVISDASTGNLNRLKFGESVVLYEQSDVGTLDEYQDCPTIGDISPIVVRIETDSGTIFRNVNIDDPGRWTFFIRDASDGLNGPGTAECWFFLRDDDIK